MSTRHLRLLLLLAYWPTILVGAPSQQSAGVAGGGPAIRAFPLDAASISNCIRSPVGSAATQQVGGHAGFAPPPPGCDPTGGRPFPPRGLRGIDTEASVNSIPAILALGLLVVVAVAVVRLLFDVVTVHDYERGLRYRRGEFTGLLDAGAYVAFRPVSHIDVIDVRPAFLVVDGQDVLTADGVNIRISLVARYVVGDPAGAVRGDQDYHHALYVTIQLGLRQALTGRTVEELLANRTQVGPAVMERCAGPLAGIGIELLSVDVRDLLLPGELKRAYAGVVAARKQGEIALERARGETAALRNLANAARMLEEHPALVQLRAIEEVAGTTGNTVVLGVPEGTVPRAARRTPATAGRPESRAGVRGRSNGGNADDGSAEPR
jgi:regulator of protease activity HflC (stomatin/prohibitin superfamily)